jgi:hypothetical protein
MLKSCDNREKGMKRYPRRGARSVVSVRPTWRAYAVGPSLARGGSAHPPAIFTLMNLKRRAKAFRGETAVSLSVVCTGKLIVESTAELLPQSTDWSSYPWFQSHDARTKLFLFFQTLYFSNSYELNNASCPLVWA